MQISISPYGGNIILKYPVLIYILWLKHHAMFLNKYIND